MNKNRARTTRHPKNHCRRAAATVEFAIVAPLLFLSIVVPVFEFGRGMMASQIVANAARSGCRTGVLPNSDTSAIQTAVNNNLNNQTITGATTTVLVNGASANASTAVQGDQITVTVTVPYNSISWLPSGVSRFLGGKSLSSTQVMRRE